MTRSRRSMPREKSGANRAVKCSICAAALCWSKANSTMRSSAFAAARTNSPDAFGPACISAIAAAAKEMRKTRARVLRTARSRNQHSRLSNERLRFGILISALGVKNEAGAQARSRSSPFRPRPPPTISRRPPGLSRTAKHRDANKWIDRARDIFGGKSPPGLRGSSTISAG